MTLVQRLYRSDYYTFQDYCRERLGFANNYARKLMLSATAVENVRSGTIVPSLPATESQARPLTVLPEDQQAEVLQEAVVNVSSIVAGEYAENEVRKDFTVSERVAIGELLEKMVTVHTLGSNEGAGWWAR